MTRTRKGDWIQTFTGGEFWPADPRASEVRAEDIAHALALQCRFAGHCRVPYSVAEHSVRATDVARSLGGSPIELLATLLHDASEAYVVDLPRPVKRLESIRRAYAELEDGVARVIASAFDLPPDAFEWDIVKRSDEIMLATEARDVMGPPPRDWKLRGRPLEHRIAPWTWQGAEEAFLFELARLREALRGEAAREGR